MKQIIYLFIISLFSISSFAQNKYEVLSEHYEDNTSLIRIKINDEPIINENGGYGFKIKTAINYTSFSIGWLTNSDNALPKDFLVVYKVHKPDIGWSDWKTDDGNTSPNQTATQAYYSDLLFGVDEWLHDSIEFYIHPPEGTELTEFQMVLQDISSSIKLIMPETEDTSGAKSCPEFPNIILRSEWCGSYSACHNPTYSVTYRNATHTVIHHGASPDNYTDGAAVIRSYWNYHVNTHGWADIGYNYLFDKYGNFFLGRHNPNYPFQDVHAAHAGNANTYSIGLNFLGDSDSPNTAPTEPQLQKCAQFLAWWYDYKTFDPQSSASILNQAGNQWLNLPRICGHRDVNPGGTTCPGNALYQLLPNLRNRTTQVLADCNILPDTEPPTSEIIIERKWQNSKFDVQFIDEDNLDGSGVKYSFYQIMDFDSQEWRANANNGFFNDNFNSAIHPEWTQASGDWTISEQHLKQSEQTSANTN
ncbi:MAG: N-acetylmuramoyl-L-alanine amidase, partial [Bacteroidales bacterium]|nr:N-acetylmuramoyl-L-alanine amidase [Bacteroidales bacterium]